MPACAYGCRAKPQAQTDASILWRLDNRDVTQNGLTDRMTRQTWLIVNDRLNELRASLDPNTPLAERAQT
jgi:hypothetical protein